MNCERTGFLKESHYKVKCSYCGKILFLSVVIYHTFTKRKFKQWYSTIAPISTKRTTTSHTNSPRTLKTHDIWRWKSKSWLGTETKM